MASHFRRYWGGFLIGAVLGVAVPAIAQNANFDPINLSSGATRAAVQGYTGGSFSLSAVSNRDRAGNLCVGFADSTPDHIMTLEGDRNQLTLQVDSGGNDTTLVVQGPGDAVRCGDDTGSNKDASIQDSDWPSGTYRIWVGAFESGARHDYTLRVSN